MTDTTRQGELLEVLRDVLVDRLQLSVERDQIQPDTPLFGTGLGMDSIDAVDLVVGIEAATKLRIPDTWQGRLGMRTVNSLILMLIDLEAADDA